MKFKIIALLIVSTCVNPASGNNLPDKEIPKPRIVVLTDVSTWETDDSESLVRLLVHADLFEIEGIVFTTGWSLDETRDDFFQLITDAIDAYEKDLPGLMKRSGQTGFREDELRQSVGYWPSPGYLRKRAVYGSRKRGVSQLGPDNTSEGSNLIIAQADETDERPLWILLWGGGNTLAQAIWQVQQERDPGELRNFLHKIPVYAITDQDRSYKNGTPYHISSQLWMRKEFEKDLMFLWDECAWKLQNGTGRENWDQYANHIQGHGNLGDAYPKYKFGVEGDTPSFLHVMPNGLNNPLAPGQAGWGGYFEWSLGPDDSTFSYTNHEGTAYEICHRYASYFYQAAFNNFAARMDWASGGEGNRNPEVVINGEHGIDQVHMEKGAGELVSLDASASFDHENDRLNYHWWILPEAGTYRGKIEIPDKNADRIRIRVPADSAGKLFHVICEITDTGEPNLTGYRRIIVHVND